MGIFDKFERSIDGAVNSAFARVFKGDVQPVEIATRLVRELDAEARLLSRERRLVPNEFTVGLSPHDYDRLAPYAKALNAEIIPELREHAGQRGYVFNGPINIYYEEDTNLPTGRFAVYSEAVAAVRNSRATSDASEEDLVLEVNGIRHQLTPPGFTIGRGSDADVRINDPGISRRHAQIEVYGDGATRRVEIVDLGSTNGVNVNGRRIQGRAEVGPGSRIQVGTTRMLIHAPGAGG